MPRVKRMLTADEEFTAEQIKKDYGTMLDLASVMKYIGCRSVNTAKRFLSGVDSVEINGKRRYLAVDIARKVEAGRVRACG